MKLMQQLVLLALAVLAAHAFPKENNKAKKTSTGSSKISKHIVSGSVAVDGQFPWMAALKMEKLTQSSICGGSLIHVNWVLTAAHCLDGATSVKVRLGSVNRTSNDGNIQTSTRMFIHPSYKPGIVAFDIALINLPAAAPLTNNIKPIAIVPPETKSFSPLLIMGWGRTGYLEDATDILLWAAVKQWEAPLCTKAFAPAVNVTDANICALGTTTNNESVCKGDSGGPLVLNTATKYLVGVSSFTERTCKISGYTLADKHRPWIYTITNIQF